MRTSLPQGRALLARAAICKIFRASLTEENGVTYNGKRRGLLVRKWMLLLLLLLLPAVMTEARADLPGAPMIMLKGNPTTGYGWSWEIDEERVVDVGVEYAADWQFRQEGEPVLTGTGGRYLLPNSSLPSNSSA